MTWYEFEQTLHTEFQSILNDFIRLKEDGKLSKDTQKDFLGLLRYTLKDRGSFRTMAETTQLELLDATEDAQNNNFDNLTKVIDELLEIIPSNHAHSTFPSQFTHLPSILANWNRFEPDSLVSLCEKYWKLRYPSIKESFIIPVAVNIFASFPDRFETTQLKKLLKTRLLKGKLAPFDQSVALCKIFAVQPDDLEYFDGKLAALKDILANHQQAHQEMLAVLKQSGCHCD